MSAHKSAPEFKPTFASSYNISTYSRFNLSENESDIHVFIGEYRHRIMKQLQWDNEGVKAPFISFADSLTAENFDWLEDNSERFFRDTENYSKVKAYYLAQCGYIFCMLYAHDGTYVIVGHSTGLIQMRHGSTGTVLCTLRSIQFPPKPIYSLAYSRDEERVCYAASMDGNVYRIEIPSIDSPITDNPGSCIRADPLLDTLNMQFYGGGGISSYSTAFITQRSPALSVSILAENNKLVVGYADTSVKVYDMETQEAEITYKVHKLRLQFIPKKLRRMHSGQVCALKCHDQKPNLFATSGWDQTLRIWDVRCKVGCVMTFEGVNVCSDSIDLNREHCLVGSWQPTEALTEWDLVAKKRLSVVRVQNRRPDVDGEYIYACRYWHSIDYNRKGKYAVIGGSGTKCVEVINLHNRYIACSYPTAGTVLATTSYQERIAFGGTSTAFSIVNFYDPKHEKDKYQAEQDQDYDYTKGSTTFFEDDDESLQSDYMSEIEHATHSVAASTVCHKSQISRLM